MPPVARTDPRDRLAKQAIARIALALVTLHNAEEAFAFRVFLPRIPALLGEPFSALAQAVSYPAMLLALAMVTVVAAMIALALIVRPQSPWALWALLTLVAVMGINAVAHVASALLVFGGYGPGLITALLLNAPFAVYCFVLARRNRWASGAMLLSTIPAALVLHGPVLMGVLWLAGR
jgi:hypothetical protein